MPTLCKIADPETYRPCHWELAADDALREFWLGHFAEQIESTLEHALEQYGPSQDVRRRVDEVRRAFLAGLEARRLRPGDFAPLTVIDLDHLRQDLLDEHRLDDPYRDLRQRGNEASLAIYPRVVAELDGIAEADRLLALVRGVFAGNIFDMGAMEFVDRYGAGGPDFFRTRAELDARPWLVDDFDDLREKFGSRRSPYRKAMFFVDNAGSDIVLGCIPLARELARRGTEVIVSANSGPALNDVLAEECEALFERIRPVDPVVADLRAAGRLRVIANGNTIPLIDLSEIGDACDRAARDCDLIILEGMGRAIESNYHARFTCDCLKIALIKNRSVAQRLGGQTYDAVCRFDRAGLELGVRS